MLDWPSALLGGPLRLRCAHLGDSLAVAARRRRRGEGWELTVLTDMHRPDRPDEAARIVCHGGDLIPGDPARLITPKWNLAMSRSLGDLQAVPYGLSNSPEISVELELPRGYEHLILVCSDGVWDMIPPAQAVAFVAKFPPE